MQRKGKRTILGGYKAYTFKEHDVVLDKLSRLFEVAGYTKANGQPDLKRIADKSGVREGTLSRWNLRHTKRPQNAGVTAVINALGARYEIVYKGEAVTYHKVKTRADVVAAQAEKKAKRKKAA